MRKREFERYVERSIDPFKGETKDVLVQLLIDQVESSDELGDIDERDRDKKYVYMNVLTKEKLLYDKEFLDSGNWEGYIPSRYLFWAELDEEEQGQYQRLLRSVDSQNFANVQIKNYEYRAVQNEHSIKGHLEIIIGQRKSLKGIDITKSMQVSICWTDKIVATSGNGSLGSIAQGNVEAISSGIDDLTSDIPNNEESDDEEIYSRSDHGKVRIYNVGSGNMVAYLQNDGKSIVFDCGVRIDKFNNPIVPDSKFNPARDHIVKNVEPDFIVISHWHLDHYIYVDLLKTANLQGIVIPNKRNVDYNIWLTIQSWGKPIFDLSSIGSINKDVFSIFGFKLVKLFRGLGLSAPTNTSQGVIYYSGRDLDDSGLILTIGEGFKRIILPGDCSYYSWPVEPELDLHTTCKVLVPHHGGHIYTKAFQTNKDKYRTVYVSTSFLPPLRDLNNACGVTYHRSFIDSVYRYGVDQYVDYKFTCNCTKRPYIEVKV